MGLVVVEGIFRREENFHLDAIKSCPLLPESCGYIGSLAPSQLAADRTATLIGQQQVFVAVYSRPYAPVTRV
jgi:hypothetical protein